MTIPPFYTSLEHEGILSVTGADAAQFLQGQLTCNIEYLHADKAGIGARCNNKGRMFSTFRIVTDGNLFLLALAAELIPGQLTDLSKYAVFSKVTLTDASAQWSRFGLYRAREALKKLELPIRDEADSVSRQANGCFVIELTGDRFELWCPAELESDVRRRLDALLTATSLNNWLLLQIRQGEGQIFGKSSNEYVPQMINLQAIGGVSFKKGCYMGQEIVARMQYLGRSKRRLFRLSAASSAAPEIMTPLYSIETGDSIGQLLLTAAVSPDVIEMLAVVQEASIDGGIALGQAQGPVCSVLPLPYSLDRDEEIKH